MKINTFVRHLEKIEKLSGRNEIVGALAQLLRETEPQEIDKACYLVLGRLLPRYRGVEFNLAEKTMLQVVALAFSRPLGEVRQLFHRRGDLGIVAEELRHQEKTVARNPNLTWVYRQLLAIARDKGNGSQQRKIRAMATLLRQLSPRVDRYLVRIPLKKLRLGFSLATILDALSWLQRGDKSLRSELQYAFNVSADIGRVAFWLKTKGPARLRQISAKPGVPIMAALAEREVSLTKILERMHGEALLEPKYDGFRVQIHLNHAADNHGGKRRQLFAGDQAQVHIYSRSTKDITAMLPELVKATRKLPFRSLILDGEAIGYNPKSKKFVSFQETTTRRRKYGVRQAAAEIPIRAFIFDILYLNGVTLIRKPFYRRRQLLQQVLAANQDFHLALTPQTKVTSVVQARRLFRRYIRQGLEGVLVKEARSQYHAGQRKFSWIKFKRAMAGGLADTVDCLLMGYYYGRGKRQKFGLGALLVGVYNPVRQEFVTISKIGTGLSDQQWQDLHRQAEKFKTPRPPRSYRVPKELIPDVWLKPALVIEVSADVISRSPLHTAGYALRFPRFQRLRDKLPQEATTLREIRELFRIQGEEKH